MDYRELLKKYIDLVCLNEGTDFLNIRPHNIAEDEWTELLILSEEILGKKREVQHATR